jgi:hypothetical protein
MQLLFGYDILSSDILSSESIGTSLLLRGIYPSFSLRGQRSSAGITFERITFTTFPEDGTLHVAFLDDDHRTDSNGYGNK